MSWETAKTFIDYVLSHEDDFPEESVIWDFIGGEPFLEIDLIDMICDYLKQRMFELNHHWFNSYRFSFSTNGINYHEPKVQKFIEKSEKRPSHKNAVNKWKSDLIWLKGYQNKGDIKYGVKKIIR